MLYDKILYKLGLDSDLRQCISPIEVVKVPTKLHERPAKEHFGINTIIKKTSTSNYCQPTLNKDATEMCETCDICQRLGPLC
jgi:hypothetical protein